MATQTLRTGTAWLVDFVVTINSPNILLFQNKQKSIVQINGLSILRCHNKKSKYFVVSKRKGRIIRFFKNKFAQIDVLSMTDLAVNNRKMRIDLASQVFRNNDQQQIGNFTS